MAINLKKRTDQADQAPIDTKISYSDNSVKMDLSFFKALILKANGMNTGNSLDFYGVIKQRMSIIHNQYNGRDILYQLELLNHFIELYGPENAIFHPADDADTK